MAKLTTLENKIVWITGASSGLGKALARECALQGAQVVLTPHLHLFNAQQNIAIFLFGEYRYLSSNYHWEGLAVDFRSHYGLLGIGLRF